MEIDFQKYRPEEILKTIAASEWASNTALRQEWEGHRNDWVRQGVALSIKEFAVLQDELITKARSKEAAIFHFLHNNKPQLALYGRLRLKGKLLKDVALMYDIGKNERVGFYRRTLSNLKKQPEFVVIQGEE